MRNRRLLDYGFAGLLLLLAAVFLHANLKNPERLNGFDQAILRLSSPLQAGVFWVIEGIGGVFHSYVWLVDVEEENEELREQNRQLREQLVQAHQRSAEMELLEELVTLRREIPADTVGARVLAASMNAFYRVGRLRIDRGESEIETGMPVVNGDGLVGRIGRSYGEYADVLLLSDPRSSVDVEIRRTGNRGILHGLGDDRSYACEIEMLERKGGDIEVGDIVVTTGLGDFPAGFEVGRASKVKSRDYELFQEVEVTPSVDFTNLDAVIVLLAPPPRPDPEAGMTRRSERAFGVVAY